MCLFFTVDHNVCTLLSAFQNETNLGLPTPKPPNSILPQHTSSSMPQMRAVPNRCFVVLPMRFTTGLSSYVFPRSSALVIALLSPSLLERWCWRVAYFVHAQFLVTTFREQRRLFDDPISELRIGIFSDSVVTVHEHACLSEVLDLLELHGGFRTPNRSWQITI